MDENEIDSTQEVLRGQYDATHLSDVIEVIKETDPDFTESNNASPKRKPSPMFNGGGEVPAPQPQQAGAIRRHQAYVKIIEQPASKALRFRYECEGRSAGSIPGASSTPENKTFPEIQVEGYRGRAVVVVSCVTKDAPYKTHPHNLVGREGCKRGVCTLEIPPDTMRVQFSNLGIQCVKKRDIESALRQREEIRVDPFRQGYAHRNQPTSIDLNAVRLCFQVFLEGDTPGKFNVALNPVVSDVIYDKKAMSDLTIIKLSDCVSYVDGGRKDIILLCEKVAKEDIQVRFYEEKDGQIVWERQADFQPSQVHKQHAIWFRPPSYRTLDITEPVKVFIQLRRPSDGITSEPLPFELLPLDSGRPSLWSFKRGLTKKANYELFNSILVNDAKLITKRQLSSSGEDARKITEKNNNEDIPSYADVKKSKLDDDVAPISGSANNVVATEEKSFNELINQVAELDEIYSETHAKLMSQEGKDTDKTLPGPPQDDSFDDARTYTSLQLAFKNPVPIDIWKGYEDVHVNPPSPITEAAVPTPPPIRETAVPVVPPKRDTDAALPPLPPKRTKKIETYIGGSMTSIQLSGKQAENLLTRSGSMRSASVSRSHSFNLQRPKSQGELVPPGKRLPPIPNASSTLPNPKKRGFFSKLFGRKSKTNTPVPSREASVTPSHTSTKSLQVGNNLSKSIGNVSTHSSNSIRIRLKDDSPPPPPQFKPVNALPLPSGITTSILSDNPNGEEELDLQLDLTEAENYALYTAMAPHATQSEFDEFSCYYAPVEGGRLLTTAEVAARLAIRLSDKHNKRKRAKIDEAQILRDIAAHEKRNAQHLGAQLLEPIKTEPRDSTSPYSGASPYGGHMYAVGISPNHVPSPGLSPRYNPHIDTLLPTPSPENVNFQYQQQPANFNILQPIKTDACRSQQSTWNITTNNQNVNFPSISRDTMNNISMQNYPCYLNLDTQQVNSAELACTIDGMNILRDGDQLPEIKNLSLSDIAVVEGISQDQNMTDSLTRLVNETAGNLL